MKTTLATGNAGTRPPVGSPRLSDKAANALWATAVSARNRLKRAGLLGPLDGLSAFIGPRLMRPPADERPVPIPLGLTLIVPPRSPSFRNFATGLYESEVTEIVLSTVKAGMTVVDLGASIGYYTLLASRLVATEGRVYAFEPDPEASEYLRRNTEANRCEQVIIVNKAASNQTQRVSFVKPELERGFISAEGRGSMLIEAITLDEYFGGLGWPDVHVIKMDIEGSEESALLGMGELVRRNPTMQIILELNRQAMHRGGRRLSDLLKALDGLGFTAGYLIELHRQVQLDALSNSRAIHNLLLTKGKALGASTGHRK